MSMDSDIQREILSNIRFWPKWARYSQLRLDYLEDDLFNYHLQHLVKKGYLKKEDDAYVLTETGKSMVTNIDEVDVETPPTYKVSVYLCPVVKGKVLLYRRKKHPQFGYAGFISEKVRYGEGTLEAAKRGLMEETGLSADFRLIGNLRQVRKNEKGEVVEDGVFYVCFTDKVNGELKPSREGDYFWVELGKVSEVEKLFRPSVEMVIEETKKGLKQVFIYDISPEVEEY